MNFIELQGQDQNDEQKRPIQTLDNICFNEFLTEPYSMWFIQGASRSGKSVFLKMIEYKLWKSYKLGESKYIPIHVNCEIIRNPQHFIPEIM